MQAPSQTERMTRRPRPNDLPPAGSLNREIAWVVKAFAEHRSVGFEVGAQYTRAQIQQSLDVPEDRRGGDWATGYTRFADELFVFCNVGSAGRTGHDYPNRWDGEQLVWSAKSR